MDQENPRGVTKAIRSERREKEGQRDESVHKMDPARIATKVMITASLDESKPGAPFGGLLDAEGVGTDAVGDPEGEGPDEEEELVELVPVALAYGNRASVSE